MSDSPAIQQPDRVASADVTARLEAEAAWLTSRHVAAAAQVTVELAGRLAALFPPGDASQATLLDLLSRGQERQWPADLIRVLAALAHVRGASWTQVGRACGTSRQAAHERFGPWEHPIRLATVAHPEPPLPTPAVPAGQLRVSVHPGFDRRDELAAALQAVYGVGEVVYHDVPSTLDGTARITTSSRDETVDIPTLLRARTQLGGASSAVVGHTNPTRGGAWRPTDKTT
jgi:hypothetical protein